MARLIPAILLALGLAATTATADSPMFSNRISPFANGKRGFCFKNSCSYPVRVGHTGASTGIPCGEGCPQGTICNPPVGLCYFSLDAIKAVPILQPKSDRVCIEFNYPTVETRVYVPSGIVKLRVAFSGTIYGSTGCSADGICQTALCVDCPSYVGPTGPMMQAEMTMQEIDQDYYDVTAIHGSNSPMVMRPLSPTGIFYNPSHAIFEYSCGEPGTIEPMRNEKVSSWNYRPPSEHGGGAHYAIVENTGIPCSASCKETCGLAMKIGGNGHPTADVIPNTCGKLQGVWSDSEMCGWTDANKFGFCKDDLPNAEKGGTYQEAFRCAGPYAESCFQRTATPGCCGCTVWPEFGLTYDTTNPCWSTSKGWEEQIMTRLRFLKEACPTCYTYPYDDATSLFTCRSVDASAKNWISYEIEWCPGGVELTVKTAGSDTPAPWTPRPITPVPSTPKPSTPSTPKPSTPVPSTPKPATPKPATPVPSTPKPATPVPATPRPQTPAPWTPVPWTPVPSTPTPWYWTPNPPTPGTRAPLTPVPETPAPATPSPPASPPRTNEPPQAANEDKTAVQDNSTAIALGVIAVVLACVLITGVVLGVVFRKKLFGNKDAQKAQALPSSPMGPRSPDMSYEEDPAAASTEPLPA